MTYKRKRRHAVKLPHYQLADIKPLGNNREIEAYLRDSGVWAPAQDKLKELYYYVRDESGRRKDFHAAGWLNELGHWQVAAPNFTGCLSHPALTIFHGETNEAWLFQSCFDYLRDPQTINTKAHIIILNDPRLMQAGLAKAKSFSQTRTFFNNTLPDPQNH
jgi:hypothetical protein